MGNLVYLGVAFFWVSVAAMDLFRYRTTDDIFKLADIEKDGTNWFKIATLVQLWTRFVAWTVPLITQALSMFGMAASLNQVAWNIFPLIVGLVGGVANFLKNQSLTKAEELKDNNAKGSALWTQGDSLIKINRDHQAEDTAYSLFATSWTYEYLEDWQLGQFQALDQIAQDEQIAEIEANIDTWGEENAEYVKRVNEILGSLDYD